MPALAHVAGVPLEEALAYAAPVFALGLSAVAAGVRGMIAGRLPGAARHDASRTATGRGGGAPEKDGR